MPLTNHLMNNGYNFDSGDVFPDEFDSYHSVIYPITCHTSAKKMTGYLFSQDTDFSKQMTISADSKIINSSHDCRSRASTRRRYISGREDGCPHWFPVPLPSPYSASDDGEEAPPVFAVQTRACRARGTKKRGCKLPWRKSNKVHVENVGEGKIKAEVKMDRERE